MTDADAAAFPLHACTSADAFQWLIVGDYHEERGEEVRMRFCRDVAKTLETSPRMMLERTAPNGKMIGLVLHTPEGYETPTTFLSWHTVEESKRRWEETAGGTWESRTRVPWLDDSSGVIQSPVFKIGNSTLNDLRPDLALAWFVRVVEESAHHALDADHTDQSSRQSLADAARIGGDEEAGEFWDWCVTRNGSPTPFDGDKDKDWLFSKESRRAHPVGAKFGDLPDHLILYLPFANTRTSASGNAVYFPNRRAAESALLAAWRESRKEGWTP